MPCLSHPDKLLTDHLEKVAKIGLNIFENMIEINLSVNKKDIESALSIMLLYHDFGKATKFFQDYLDASIKNVRYTGKRDLTHHALISAIYTGYKVYEIIENEKSRALLSIIAFIAVRKHHGSLESLNLILTISKSDWRVIEEQWENIIFDDVKSTKPDFQKVKILIDDFLFKADDVSKNIELFFFTNLFFSILTYSDKSEVILGKSASLKIPENLKNIVDCYKSEKYKTGKKTELNQIREEIYNICANTTEINNQCRIFSINVPTGSGKTLAVINATLKILEADKSLKKIIYALPFTSIIDQTADILDQIFSYSKLSSQEILTVHHHLSEAKTISDENYLEGDKAQFIIENWDKPFILTTFWQLFHSLISNENGQLRKLHNMADSVIILDEIQTLPHKYWLLANQTIKTFAEMFNCRIILLTATMPLIFLEEKGEIQPIVEKEKRNEFFSKFSRYSIKTVENMKDISSDDFYEIGAKHIKREPNKSFLFVFNTIKSSLHFFRKLKNDFHEENLIYLSTNILPVDRKKRIDEIKNLSARTIIVSTQLIEAGVDIDLDIVYRDFAPLDSIVQTAGRCNRNNREFLGEVYLFRLKNGKGKNDCNYIYKGITLEATASLFDGKEEVREAELLEIINSYYKKVKDISSSEDSRKILTAMKELDYNYIYENFHLIEDKSPTALVFIELNEEASEILKQFENIMEIEDNFLKNNEFLKIRKDFFGFVLSIRKKGKESFWDELEEKQGIKILTHDKVKNVYDDDTGFVIESVMQKEEPTLFI